MENVIETGKKYVRERIYPLTLTHLIYLALLFVVTTYISNYFLRFRLIKWIYYGTLIVLFASIFQQGRDEDSKKKATSEFVKLATL